MLTSIEFTEILLLLIIAHLLGDFFLQPSSWVRSKHRDNVKSIFLWLHALIHGGLTFLVLYLFKDDHSFIWLIKWAGLVFWSHALIDLGKVALDERRKLKSYGFILDQLAHLLVLFVVWGLAFEQSTLFFELFGRVLINKKILLYGLAYLLVTNPISFFISQATLEWRKQISENSEGLLKAGQWIGILERILILTFILSNNLTAIGFLLAAKSVFRFGDMTNNTDRKRAEYIILGTLLSVTLTILLGLVTVGLQKILIDDTTNISPFVSIFSLF
ncbi:DUF3307 domain-containing protein [Xanthovirga aplysinae]|uniref:DUF3307 domain-containing protein n=1 Tax=Xanthovirga aplysinae TaxID=2529853 RepID=UPI0012BD2992|nr:DUF3307 domain-containing protein [Xanthovirga aplysinae]MTI30509.1 DUF3307 domain-containing protein [Xanthovirga aplysinae]